jgi:hypothetical protein
MTPLNTSHCIRVTNEIAYAQRWIHTPHSHNGISTSREPEIWKSTKVNENCKPRSTTVVKTSENGCFGFVWGQIWSEIYGNYLFIFKVFNFPQFTSCFTICTQEIMIFCRRTKFDHWNCRVIVSCKFWSTKVKEDCVVLLIVKQELYLHYLHDVKRQQVQKFENSKLWWNCLFLMKPTIYCQNLSRDL